MIPSIGRIVEYTLTRQEAESINKRRLDAVNSEVSKTNSGAVVHAGNHVVEGEKYPLIITRVWGTHEGAAVNGQVLLDGNDNLWVTSRVEGVGAGQWHKPTYI